MGTQLLSAILKTSDVMSAISGRSQSCSSVKMCNLLVRTSMLKPLVLLRQFLGVVNVDIAELGV